MADAARESAEPATSAAIANAFLGIKLFRFWSCEAEVRSRSVTRGLAGVVAVAEVSLAQGGLAGRAVSARFASISAFFAREYWHARENLDSRQSESKREFSSNATEQ